MEIHRLRDETPTTLCVEAEQQLLGAALLGFGGVEAIRDFGGADLFGDPLHATIAGAILARASAGALVSPVTIGAALGANPALAEVGGPAYLVRLAGCAIAAHAARDYAALLADLRRKRQLVAAINEAQAAIARGEDESDLIAGRLEAALIGIGQARSGRRMVPFAEAVAAAVSASLAAYNGEAVPAVQSGIAALDDLTGGFHAGELILVGARPSMGKTALALSIALNVARAGGGVAIASLEMTPQALATRALSEATARMRTAAGTTQIRRGHLTENQCRAVVECGREIVDLPITFLPAGYSDLGALIAGIRQARARMRDLRLIVIDYLQLIRGEGAKRYEQITEISIALKALAAETGIPILALSQLSRAVESRNDKRPQLSDLRESGQLEQDADTIIFPYREEYYVEREEPDPLDDEAHTAWRGALAAVRNRLDLIVAKQRQGPTGVARVRCNVALNLIWEDGR